MARRKKEGPNSTRGALMGIRLRLTRLDERLATMEAWFDHLDKMLVTLVKQPHINPPEPHPYKQGSNSSGHPIHAPSWVPLDLAREPIGRAEAAETVRRLAAGDFSDEAEVAIHQAGIR